MRYYLLLITLYCCIPIPCYAQQQVIRYIQDEGDLDHRHEYFIKLLRLALDKDTEDAENMLLQPAENYMSQSRSFHQLINNDGIDIIWNGTSIAREQHLHPIRIPLIKGLLGYRVLIINKKDKDKFASVKTINDLKKYTAGQGFDWPDTQILRANQLAVVTSSNYLGLFKMLLSGRFDYFPRGINEAQQELASYNNGELMVNEHIVLRYTFPVYFFVNKNNAKLANSIEQGLNKAIADGSFEQLFNDYYQPKKILSTYLNPSSIIIDLENPLLPALTPIENKEFWLQFQQ